MDRRTFLSYTLGFFTNILLFGCARHTAGTAYTRDAQPGGVAVSEHPRAMVIYDSWSGNTQMIAEAMAGALDCPAVKVDDAGRYQMDDYDLVFVGSPVHGGVPTDKIEQFLSELQPPRASAVFVTFGAPVMGPFTADSCLDVMEGKLHGTSLGRFRCHGFHQIFRTYPTHPDEQDKADAARFAAGLMERCCRIIHTGALLKS